MSALQRMRYDTDAPVPHGPRTRGRQVLDARLSIHHIDCPTSKCNPPNAYALHTPVNPLRCKREGVDTNKRPVNVGWFAQTDGEHGLANVITPLVHCLLQDAAVPPSRIFSVFGPATLARAFATAFVAQAHAQGAHAIKADPKPYYDATLTFCSTSTLRALPDEPFPLREGEGDDVVIELRRARVADLEQVQALFKAFSETSPPYELDDARARLEAETILNGADDVPLWVHMIQRSCDESPQMACVVATTRCSANVTAVTKVFTHKDWRRRGCAVRLLHRVCAETLEREKRVVLYVGTDLTPAHEAYRKIGFQGMEATQGQQVEVEGVERWLEIGFEPTRLGYW